MYMACRSLFISKYLRKREKERIQQRRPQTAVVQHLSFFSYYTTNCNDAMVKERDQRVMADCRLGNSFLSCRTEKKRKRKRKEIKKGGCSVVCHYTKSRVCGKKNKARVVLFFFFLLLLLRLIIDVIKNYVGIRQYNNYKHDWL